MTATATDYPVTKFHADGVRTMVATDEAHEALLRDQGWLDLPAEPPPPAEPPMTPEERAALAASELEGLGDQVDAQAAVLSATEDRLTGLESQVSAILELQKESAGESLQFSDISGKADQINESERKLKFILGEVVPGLQERIKALEDALANAGESFVALNERLAALESKKKTAKEPTT